MAVDQRSWLDEAVPDTPIWRLTVAQYHQMVQTGILTDDDPVELLEGWLVISMPKNSPHRLATQLTSDLLAQALPVGWHVNSQEPITTADSESEPDVAVIRGNRRDYRERHPKPAEVGLVVEVLDITLQRDRTIKQRLYAAANIPCYWIINLAEGQIEVYSEPQAAGSEPRYNQRHDYLRGTSLPFTLDGQPVATLAVDELLG